MPDTRAHVCGQRGQKLTRTVARVGRDMEAKDDVKSLKDRDLFCVADESAIWGRK